MDITFTDEYDLTRSQWEELIEERIFNERDRAILKRRLLDGICFEPLSEEFGLSTQYVKEIVHRSKRKLFKYL